MSCSVLNGSLLRCGSHLASLEWGLMSLSRLRTMEAGPQGRMNCDWSMV